MWAQARFQLFKLADIEVHFPSDPGNFLAFKKLTVSYFKTVTLVRSNIIKHHLDSVRGQPNRRVQAGTNIGVRIWGENLASVYHSDSAS